MQKYARPLCALILIPFLCSCLSERLTAHMSYLSRKSLASYHVDTPDPCLNDPPLGQRLLISWNLPKENVSDVYLKLTVRFNNREEKVICQKLRRNWGTYTYTLINEAYFACCGIQTYKVELIRCNEVVECWQHQLWAELIILNTSSNQ